MLNVLIIKLGAMGDVLRTTPLLRVITGDVYWITQKECIPLLAAGNNLKKIIDVDYAERELRDMYFDLVICLDDSIKAAELATRFNNGSLIGSFADTSGKVSYTGSSKEWFDMGLISKLGRKKSDGLKKRNTKSYQEIIFAMFGKEFKGEEYTINFNGRLNKDTKREILIGIESRADGRWSTKQWNKYKQLAEVLHRDGLIVRFFQQRDTIHEYINDLSECGLIITGDTLSLHIALALKIKVVAIFTCTSAAEIYDYSRMIKVISPALEKAFYSREYIKEAVDAISVENVYESVKKLLYIRDRKTAPFNAQVELGRSV